MFTTPSSLPRLPRPALPRRRALPPALLLVAGLVIAAPLHGQAALDLLQALAAENAERYLAPGAEGLGRALAAGAFDRATVLPAFHVDLGLRVAGAPRDDRTRTFAPVLPGTVTWTPPSGPPRSYTDPYVIFGSVTETPSITGRGEGLLLVPSGSFRSDLQAAGENPDDFALRFPAGLDVSVVPAALLSLSVGVGLATEITLRYVPALEVSPDLGAYRGQGFALKHEVSRWIPSPLDLAVGVGSLEVEVDDFLQAQALEGWILAGRSLGPLSVWGSLGMRRTSVDVAYRAENPTGIPGLPADGLDIRFSVDPGTQAAWGGGARLQLLLLNLSVQYNAGDPGSFSLKVAVGIP